MPVVLAGGVSEVTRGGDKFFLPENENAYVPQGTKHRLRNFGEQTLELIDVQVVDCLGNDDCVLFIDLYGRDET